MGGTLTDLKGGDSLRDGKRPKLKTAMREGGNTWDWGGRDCRGGGGGKDAHLRTGGSKECKLENESVYEAVEVIQKGEKKKVYSTFYQTEWEITNRTSKTTATV